MLIASVPAGIVGILFDDILDKLFLQVGSDCGDADRLWRVVYCSGKQKQTYKTVSYKRFQIIDSDAADYRRVPDAGSDSGNFQDPVRRLLELFLIGVSREVAAEFIFLAIPAMFGGKLFEINQIWIPFYRG